MLCPTDPSDVRVAKTASRSVLGRTNEMAFDVEHLVASYGGLAATDVDDVNRCVRRQIRGLDRGYVVTLELAAARCA